MGVFIHGSLVDENTNPFSETTGQLCGQTLDIATAMK
jgi:hypothetical protein